ncbi:MAG TPA: chromosome segregation protein SMC, partial [Myxococcaceae bacterium]|nr:chromosome segregation protein SMC [Myxococcaceae bacterium]
RRATQVQAELSTRLESERGSLLELTRRLSRHETDLSNLARRKEELEVRRVKSRAEADRLRAEEAALEFTRADVEGRVHSTRQSAQELAERKGAEELSLSQTRQAFTENEIRVISARESLGDKRNRLQLLEEIQRNYEGFDRGVRAVMKRAGAEPQAVGVHGLVADVVSTTPQYEKAVEAALGERLQSVIVDHRDRALELIQYLKATSEGRSSFLPLRAGEPDAHASLPSDLSRPGVLASAVAEVRCDEAFRPLVNALLGNTVIVSDLSVARACADAGQSGFTWVTLEGEVVRADGTVTGGTLEGSAVGALQKKREVAELTQEVALAEAHYNEVLTRHYELQKQMGHSEGVLKGLAKNQHAEELSLASQEKDLHQAGEDLSRLRERIETLVKDEAALAESMNALGREEESLRGEIGYAQADRDGREERVRQMGAEWEALKKRADTVGSELTELRIRVAADLQRAEAVRKEAEGLRAQGLEAASRAERLESMRSGGAEQVAELERQSEEARG